MCCPLSTSWPVSRSAKAVARPPRRDRPSSTSTRAPRWVRRTAALNPANPAPMTTTSGPLRSITSAPQPLPERDQRLARLRDASAGREHVVAAALDPLQGFEIDRAHDFGGDQALPIGARPRVDRPLIKFPRPAAPEFEQGPHRGRDDAGGEIVDGAAAGGEIVERQVDAAALEIAPHIPQDVGQLQGDAEVQRVVAGALVAAAPD